KAPLTIASQNTHLTSWSQRLGHRDVTDIGASLIAEERAKLAWKVTPATVNRYLAVLSHVLSTAVEWGFLDNRPKFRKLREPRRRTRFLSDDERPRLLDACIASRN